MSGKLGTTACVVFALALIGCGKGELGNECDASDDCVDGLSCVTVGDLGHGRAAARGAS